MIAHYDPRHVIVLGDGFHSTAAADGMDFEHVAFLNRLQQGRKWTWLAGNHDPIVPARAGGDVCSCMIVRGIMLRHQPEATDDATEIAGHLHPAARLSIKGDTVRKHCFIGNSRRLILPAFGALAGGLNVRAAAFSHLFGPSLAPNVAVYMLGNNGVFSVPTRSLIPD